MTMRRRSLRCHSAARHSVMTTKDLEAIVRGIAPVLAVHMKQQVEASLGPLLVGLRAAEGRIAGLEAAIGRHAETRAMLEHRITKLEAQVYVAGAHHGH